MYKFIIILILSSLSCLGQAFSLNDLPFISKVPTPVAGGGGGSCPSGLIVSWKGDSALTDSQGTNVLVEPFGPVSYTAGLINNAFSFSSGSFRPVQAPDSPELSMGVGVKKSWSFWVHPTAANHFITIIAKGDSGGGNDEWFFYVDGSDHMQFSLYDSGGSLQSIASTATISSGSTYHIVATYDGSNIKLYVNAGTPDSMAATDGRNTSSVVWVGLGYVSSVMYQE
jgi:hypothetical protein